MDINKVFPKPPEVEEEMRRQKELDVIRAEQEELARVKALAPVLVPPTMSQLMAAQIGSNYSEYIPKRLHFFFLMPSKMQYYVDKPSFGENILGRGAQCGHACEQSFPHGQVDRRRAEADDGHASLRETPRVCPKQSL